MKIKGSVPDYKPKIVFNSDQEKQGCSKNFRSVTGIQKQDCFGKDCLRVSIFTLGASVLLGPVISSCLTSFGNVGRFREFCKNEDIPLNTISPQLRVFLNQGCRGFKANVKGIKSQFSYYKSEIKHFLMSCNLYTEKHDDSAKILNVPSSLSCDLFKEVLAQNPARQDLQFINQAISEYKELKYKRPSFLFTGIHERLEVIRNSKGGTRLTDSLAYFLEFLDSHITYLSEEKNKLEYADMTLEKNASLNKDLIDSLSVCGNLKFYLNNALQLRKSMVSESNT